MRARFASLPQRAQIGIAVGIVLASAVAAWFLLVSPKQAEATALADDVAAAELRLVEAQVAATRPPGITDTGASEVLQLVKAMPASTDQSSLVLELELLGRATGLKIASIAPGEPVVAAGGPTSIPVVVTAEGSYRQIARFLGRARGLVRMRGQEVRARGRLLTVQALDLSESEVRSFPRLDANITFNAFVYDGPIAAATPQPSNTDDAGDTSGATSAAGATP
jgi:Tfp pilus assembly protein PilO